MDAITSYLSETPPQILWALAGVVGLFTIFFVVRAFTKKSKFQARTEARELDAESKIAPTSKDTPEETSRETAKEKSKETSKETSKAETKKDIKSLLAKTQEAFTSKLESLLLATKNFDQTFLDSLEELLYTSDLGPKTVEKLLVAVRENVSWGELSDLQTVKKALYEQVSVILKSAKSRMTEYPNGHGEASEGAGPKPWVILIVGVNGVGKTTSIGKLAQYFSEKKKKVMVVAGDTFRAAAEAQLATWGERAHVEVFTSSNTKDAAAVAFQGIEKGKAENIDVVIVDTAGRLHNKENLMEELKKVKRVVAKGHPGAPHEIILVIDANSGQNARVQAQQFNEALGVTSLIVTKLDGTARGGVIVSIAEEVGLPVQFVGTGEKINDLSKFSTEEYAKGLLRL